MRGHVKQLGFAFLTSTLLLFSVSALAENAVIVHPSNSAKLNQDQVAAIFLGKASSFPDGSEAIPVDQAEGSDIRKGFSESVLGKSPSQLKSFWSEKMFTGKGSPPKSVSDAAAVKELVSDNPNTIGYVDEKHVDGNVKVVFKF
ncbi:hypothetical protein C8D92_10212 [Tamilnaduibacter salinus]|uniref:Phosphate ABC transporter substrate-binding protein n=1 Tax=Tamilnaduibacter salinus TaxID=1484056 RepID=A0A2U1CYW6_9GAMM|nr:phosphate ABC transporter substrate-binding protein [Tamilnaduibacter salinus]PVY77980.1 hypothetical protein C8D92_10212 [Tamilnaduibacter salinus]